MGFVHCEVTGRKVCRLGCTVVVAFIYKNPHQDKADRLCNPSLHKVFDI